MIEVGGCDSRDQMFLKSNFYHGYIIFPMEEVLPQTKMKENAARGYIFCSKLLPIKVELLRSHS